MCKTLGKSLNKFGNLSLLSLLSQLSCVYTSLKTNIVGSWYFDSGCSKHMTGTKEFLKDIVEMNGSSVKYGNGGKGRILGMGTLNVPGFPPLQGSPPG